jgi:hypothetical protein
VIALLKSTVSVWHCVALISSTIAANHSAARDFAGGINPNGELNDSAAGEESVGETFTGE